jgi:hypothetical protein
MVKRTNGRSTLGLLVGFLATMAASAASACACVLEHIAIDPIAPDRTDVYVGASELIEVRFSNFKTSGPVETFPEPPLIVQDRRSKVSCSIDGGVWSRQSVFVSRDGSVLVTHEFSGSNDTLNFYDTKTCARRHSLDVSNATWSIDGSAIQITRSGQQGGARVVHLDARCQPEKPSKPALRKK